MPETSELAALAGKLEQLNKTIAAIQEAEAHGRWIRRLLTLAVLLFMGGFGWLYFQKGKAVVSGANLEKLSSLTEERLKDKQIQALFRNEAQILISKVQKPVTDAFSRQVQKDSARYVESLNLQGDILMARLPKQIETQVNAHYHRVLMETVVDFEKEFPELKSEKDKEAMIGNLALGLTSLSKKYYVDQVEKEAKTLLATWQEFPPADRAGPKDRALEDKLVEQLLDMMWYQLAELSVPQTK